MHTACSSLLVLVKGLGKRCLLVTGFFGLFRAFSTIPMYEIELTWPVIEVYTDFITFGLKSQDSSDLKPQIGKHVKSS